MSAACTSGLLQLVNTYKGTKTVLCKNKHNVGMVQCVSKYAYSCMKNQLVKKLSEQGGAFLDIATHIQFPQVDIRVSVATQSTFAAVKTHFHHPYIWQPFDVALGTPWWISAWHYMNFWAISIYDLNLG